MSEKPIGRNERRKATSCRPKKLTEAEEIELRVWYYSARTVAQKARELGISRRALFNYINRKHKPRKESLEEILSSHPWEVPQTKGDGCTAAQS